MNSRYRSLFILVFAAVTLLEIIGDVTHNEWLHYGCKPLITGLLLVFIWQSYQSAIYPQPIRWLVIGVVFALAGDVFLMIQEVDLFAPGLGAFLVMQVCYSLSFVKSLRLSGHRILLRSLWVKALPFLLYVISFLLVLRPVFVSNPTLSIIWWPLVLYAICLATMGTLSTQRQGLPYYAQVVVGALLFIFSDSVIAIDKFLLPVPGAPWLIMTTYAAAQYLITIGMTRSCLIQQESGFSTR